jgi:hypothetical protein
MRALQIMSEFTGFEHAETTTKNAQPPSCKTNVGVKLSAITCPYACSVYACIAAGRWCRALLSEIGVSADTDRK